MHVKLIEITFEGNCLEPTAFRKTTGGLQRDSCLFEHSGKTVGLRNNPRLSGFDFLFLCNVMNAGLVFLEVFIGILSKSVGESDII